MDTDEHGWQKGGGLNGTDVQTRNGNVYTEPSDNGSRNRTGNGNVVEGPNGTAVRTPNGFIPSRTRSSVLTKYPTRKTILRMELRLESYG